MMTLRWAFRVLQWHASTLSAFCRLSSTALRAGSGASFSSAFVAERACRANNTGVGFKWHLLVARPRRPQRRWRGVRLTQSRADLDECRQNAGQHALADAGLDKLVACTRTRCGM